MYLLHPKIVSSLIFTFNSANVESDFALKAPQPASVGNFFHIFRLRTNKHKKQQLVLMKNWKSALKVSISTPTKITIRQEKSSHMTMLANNIS